MTHEPTDDTDALERLLGPADEVRIVHESVDDILEQLKHIKCTIDALIPYVCGEHYSSEQRARATAELFRLQTNWNNTSVELANLVYAITDPSLKPTT